MAENRILVVDDDPIVCGSLTELLRFENHRVDTASDGASALALLHNEPYNLIITDVSMPGLSGFDVLKKVKVEHPLTEVILTTAYGTVENAVESIKLGAFNYLTKPLVDEEIKMMVGRCIEVQTMKAENEDLKQKLDSRLGFHNLVGKDFKMQRIYELIGAVADTKSTVLLTGESGTGKTMIARAIHHNSSRHDGPFMEVNCGALPDTLLESELFGHVRGSFTGAVSDKHGKFEAADKGTIFLDEISTASPALQVK
ncbi:MAG: sigma-54-dependent Fis family transcriptional regulator, partial [Planctomycetes bacterium]|nr:sigma-54-dependent Fis family transcriptional regulator [Planctomycetota bacterium]